MLGAYPRGRVLEPEFDRVSDGAAGSSTGAFSASTLSSSSKTGPECSSALHLIQLLHLISYATMHPTCG
jgi:hypothetical protein